MTFPQVSFQLLSSGYIWDNGIWRVVSDTKQKYVVHVQGCSTFLLRRVIYDLHMNHIYIYGMDRNYLTWGPETRWLLKIYFCQKNVYILCFFVISSNIFNILPYNKQIKDKQGGRKRDKSKTTWDLGYHVSWYIYTNIYISETSSVCLHVIRFRRGLYHVEEGYIM